MEKLGEKMEIGNGTRNKNQSLKCTKLLYIFVKTDCSLIASSDLHKACSQKVFVDLLGVNGHMHND